MDSGVRLAIGVNVQQRVEEATDSVRESATTPRHCKSRDDDKLL